MTTREQIALWRDTGEWPGPDFPDLVLDLVDAQAAEIGRLKKGIESIQEGWRRLYRKNKEE